MEFVTTPHAYKAGASGMTRVCRPTPIVRFNHMSELSLLQQLMYRLARADVWGARAFTQGSLPWNLQTRFGCQCALELLRHSFHNRQKWQ
jgi:hypothetical protein